MVYAKADVTENAINNAIAVILRSYTRAINIQERRTGSLFQQKTKAKLLEAEGHNYPFICFNYIHQNPLKAGLVKRLEDWEFSSFSEYAGLTKRTLCNKELACNFLDLPQMGSEFYKMSYEFVDEKILERLF
jgi:hypothetical protein